MPHLTLFFPVVTLILDIGFIFIALGLKAGHCLFCGMGVLVASKGLVPIVQRGFF